MKCTSIPVAIGAQWITPKFSDLQSYLYLFYFFASNCVVQEFGEAKTWIAFFLLHNVGGSPRGHSKAGIWSHFYLRVWWLIWLLAGTGVLTHGFAMWPALLPSIEASGQSEFLYGNSGYAKFLSLYLVGYKQVTNPPRLWGENRDPTSW